MSSHGRRHFPPLQNTLPFNEPAIRAHAGNVLDMAVDLMVSGGTDPEDFSIYTGLGGLALLTHRFSIDSSSSSSASSSGSSNIPFISSTPPSASGPAALHALAMSTVNEAERVANFQKQKLQHHHSHHHHPSPKLIPSFLIGDAGVIAAKAVIANAVADQTNLSSALNDLQPLLSSYSSYCADESSPVSDELLLGRSGFLFLCAYLNHNLGKDTVAVVANSLVRPVIDAIFASGRKGAKIFRQKQPRTSTSSPPPLMYWWHEKAYTGAAHGLAGICHALLLWRDLLTQTEVEDVTATLDFLISLRFPSNNLPSHVPEALARQGVGEEVEVEEVHDRLVQWCHGAPGLTLTLIHAYEVLGHTRFLIAARECGEVIWERGLLTKLGICHGIAGNIYAFLALRRGEMLFAQAQGEGGRDSVAAGSSSSSSSSSSSQSSGSGSSQTQEVEATAANLHLFRAQSFAMFLLSGPGTSQIHSSSSSFPSSSSSSSSSSPPVAHWMHLVSKGDMHAGDTPASLFEGMGGVAYALLDLCNPDGRGVGFPGYEMPRK